MTFQVAVLTQDLYRKNADNLADKHADRKYMPKQISDLSKSLIPIFLVHYSLHAVQSIA